MRSTHDLSLSALHWVSFPIGVIADDFLLICQILGTICNLLGTGKSKSSGDMDVISISSSDSEKAGGAPEGMLPNGVMVDSDDDISISSILADIDSDDDGDGEVDQVSQGRILPNSLTLDSGRTQDSARRSYPQASTVAAPRDAIGGVSDYHGQGQSRNLGKRALPASLLPPGLSNKEKIRKFQNVPLKPLGSQEDYSNDDDEELYVLHEADDIRKPVMGSYAASSQFTGNSFGAGSSHGKFGATMQGEFMGQGYDMAANHRVLPVWMNGKNDYGRYTGSSQFTGLADGREHMAYGEQGLPDHDERLIYETVLQDLAQPKSETDLDDGLLAVSLLKHQKIALAWMEQKERTSRPCSGGILADEQGLGKTVSMIALILKQMPLQRKFMSSQLAGTKLETLNLDEDDNTKPADVKQDNTNLDLEGNGNLESPDKRSLVGKLDNEDSTAFQFKKKDFSTGMSSASKGRPAGGTLVVCPASILRQWARELDEKVTNDAKLSCKIYHGSSRTKHPSELAYYDVVITTYAIITNEVPKQQLAADDDGDQKNPEDYGLTSDFSNVRKRKAYTHVDNKKMKKGKGPDFDHGPLSKVRWFRVILDEAQVIKNHRTQVSRACCGLRAKTRWCLTGTPLQNAIDDLYSYFRFLKYDPYAKYSSFSSALKHPLFRDAVTGYKKLQAVLKAVMLRRTKDTTLNGQRILKLPSKSIFLKKLCFTMEERSFYNGLYANFRDRFKKYAAEGTVKQNYANILIMLLRLRQACDHPLLVKDYSSDSSGRDSIEAARKLPKDTIRHLLNKLDAFSAICLLCDFQESDDVVVTLCGHVFCYQCLFDNLAGEGNQCPANGCNAMVGTDSVFSRGTLSCCVPDEFGTVMPPRLDFEESTMWSEGFVSTKIKATLEILISLQSRNSTQFASCMEELSVVCATSGSPTDGPSSENSELPLKAIVFSQWTSMLDLLEGSLNHSLIPYRRLDGSMSLASRDRAVKDFNTDPEVTVMIMSLKSGNLGLNMVAACHVILLDLWWNPTSEDQAIDRVHRIGQTRSVSVHRLTIEDTVEKKILELQEKKRQIASSAFGEDGSGNKAATRLTIEDLRYLFQV